MLTFLWQAGSRRRDRLPDHSEHKALKYRHHLRQQKNLSIFFVKKHNFENFDLKKKIWKIENFEKSNILFGFFEFSKKNQIFQIFLKKINISKNYFSPRKKLFHFFLIIDLYKYFKIK